LDVFNESYKVVKNSSGCACIQVKGDQEEGGDEEAVFEVQGVLVGLDLPPILARNQLPERISWAKQGVQITGLGHPFFGEAVAAILAIHRCLGRTYSLEGLRSWICPQFGHFHSLDFSNRYITPTTLVNGEPSVPFSSLVDPAGALLAATQHFGAHLADNEVLYFERLEHSPEDIQYQEVDPAVFRAGQIVQLQVSFTTVPLAGRKGTFQLLCKLRSVAILDRQLQEVSTSCYCFKIGLDFSLQAYDLALLRHELALREEVPRPLKRRVGYTSGASKRGRVQANGEPDQPMPFHPPPAV
ncbi:hypothetical protein DENSPDRAFT_788611, partial [Dentipellis sp. KUC8613]